MAPRRPREHSALSVERVVPIRQLNAQTETTPIIHHLQEKGVYAGVYPIELVYPLGGIAAWLLDRGRILPRSPWSLRKYSSKSLQRTLLHSSLS